MKTKTLRIVIPLVVLAVFGVAFALNAPLGSLSSFGWESISLLCPLGALTSMLASKMLIPRAVISLVIVVVVILLVGRAFCGWICPVPVLSKLRNAFRKPDEESIEEKDNTASGEVIDTEPPKRDSRAHACSHGCGSCASARTFDSRHFVLGGALLSAAIFGFPVFCLVCPIGLSFATVVLLILLFGQGSLTWSVIIAPVLLVIEVVFFRKWCTHICPLSAFMSLISKGNRTLRPSVDQNKCIEREVGVVCGACARSCTVAINPRHPELGSDFCECTRCRECIESCPGGAITMPLLPKANKADMPKIEVTGSDTGDTE